ncbi:hypothetical protein T05_10336 [Trichinella murrelli]|uniref:Uncharacterized protein n=1 Tax=Trichinella murrelli TaxID=144512 RepID=A0A0V0T5H8_9BILA|nr:hypothetical protein T05_10336 [Trichinella murrelli]
MDFDTVFRETRSGQNVRQIIVLPDLDVFEPDTVSENELDCTFQQSHSSSDDEKTMHPPMREENHTSGVDDRSTLKQNLSLLNNHCYYLALVLNQTFQNQMRKYHQSSGQLNTFACTLHHSFFPPSHLRQIVRPLSACIPTWQQL